MSISSHEKPGALSIRDKRPYSITITIMLELSSLTERVNMKLTVKLTDLLPVIQRVARAVPARPVEASMGAINIEVTQDSSGSYLATASAFNGEVAITGTFPVQVEGEIVALRPSGLRLLQVEVSLRFLN